MTSPFNAPGSSDYIKPQENIGHLFIVRPLMHIPSVPGFNPKPNGQPSDGILLDGVILTKAGADGQAQSFRGQTWGHSRLIASLKNSIGTLVLARIVQGTSKPGQQSVPLELQDATNDPQAVAAAQAWVDAHPGYFETPLPTAAPVQAAPAPAAVAQPAPVGYAPQYAPGFAPQQPFPVAQPVAGQQPMAYAQAAPAPVAPLAVMPTQPVPVAAPVAGPIAAVVWDQMQPAQQAELTGKGFTRGA